MEAVTVARATLRSAQMENYMRPVAHEGEVVVSIRQFSFTAHGPPSNSWNFEFA